jgi:hypothetical protein
MKVLDTITSLEKFNQIVQGIRERRGVTQGLSLPYRHEFFRGQINSTWSIIPSLSRDFTHMDALKDAEEQVMNLFKKLVKEKDAEHKIFLHEKPRNHRNEWLWMSQGQHIGVPTRLLDWTIKPEVALYFAVEDKQYDGVDGQLIVMYVPGEMLKTDSNEDEQYFDLHFRDVNETWFMNPSFFWHERFKELTPEVRRARQHGKFSLQPYDLALSGLDSQPRLQIPWNETFDVVIEKYVIPVEHKPQLRLDLISKGWHGEYLYFNEDPVLNEIRDRCKELRNSLIR